MPVYDYSYKVWEGERRPGVFRWLAIPHFAYMELLKYRTFTWALSVSSMLFIGAMLLIYLFVNESFLRMLRIPPDVLPPIDAQYFLFIIQMQFPSCFFLAFVMGASLISRDLKHNAVVLYASKPISRWEYYLGKFSVLFFVFAVLLVAAPLFLFLLQTAVAPEQSQWHQHFWERYAHIGPAIVIFGTTCAATLSLLIMTASSLTENGRYAGVAFAGFVIGAEVVVGFLTGYMRDTQFLALSPFNCAGVLGSYIFGLDADGRRMPITETHAWLGILGYWVVCIWIIHNRVSRRAQFGR